MITAKKEVDTIIDAIQFDISNYILKPIDLNNFLSEIIYHIWDDDYEQKDYISNLKNIISRLRNKIPEINIENVYGIGYKINIIK